MLTVKLLGTDDLGEWFDEALTLEGCLTLESIEAEISNLVVEIQNHSVRVVRVELPRIFRPFILIPTMDGTVLFPMNS